MLDLGMADAKPNEAGTFYRVKFACGCSANHRAGEAPTISGSGPHGHEHLNQILSIRKLMKLEIKEDLPSSIETDPTNSCKGMVGLTPQDAKKSKKKPIKKETSDSPPQQINALT